MPNLTPLVVGLVEVGAGILVPFPSVPLILGKLVETIIDDQNEIRQELGLIHGRINHLGQRVAILERRQDDLEHRLNQQILQPFRNGNTFLIRAKNESKKKEYRRRIEQAQRYFIEASAVDVSRIHRDIGINQVIPIRALFYVGSCYDLLGKKRKAFLEYSRAWELVTSIIRSQDVVYNKWQTVKRSELDWLAELMSATARKGTKLTDEETNERFLANLWAMGKLMESTGLGKPMKSRSLRKELREVKNNKLAEIIRSPKLQKEQHRKRYAKRMTDLDNYPDSLDILIDRQVYDATTQDLRKSPPVSLISRETFVEVAQQFESASPTFPMTKEHRKFRTNHPKSRLKAHMEAQPEPTNRSNRMPEPIPLNDLLFKKPRSLSPKLNYRESQDAWDLAICLTILLASRKQN